MAGFMVPEVSFAARDGLQIAFQHWGTGDDVVLAIPEWAVAGEAVWEHPGHVRAWRFYESMGRVIRFDRTGIGASDPVSPEEVASAEVWASDALAVLDAAGIERAVVAAEGFGGHAAITLAARHPERVASLILTNSHARLTKSDDYPFGFPPEVADAAADHVRRRWGDGSILGAGAHHLFAGGDYRTFCGRFERIAAPRATAAAVVKGMYTSDVRRELPLVTAPTLVPFTGDLSYVERAHSDYLAERIPSARVEVWRSGSFYGAEERRQGYRAFLRHDAGSKRETCAVLFTDIVNSTVEAVSRGDTRWRELLEDVDDMTAREVERHRGRVVTRTGDGALAAFSDARDAVAAAMQIMRATHVLGIGVRAGIHCGEVELRRDGDLAGVTVHAAARVAALAQTDEVLVSEAVAAALGTELSATERMETELKGLPGTWKLLRVDAVSAE